MIKRVIIALLLLLYSSGSHVSSLKDLETIVAIGSGPDADVSHIGVALENSDHLSNRGDVPDRSGAVTSDAGGEVGHQLVHNGGVTGVHFG